LTEQLQWRHPSQVSFSGTRLLELVTIGKKTFAGQTFQTTLPRIVTTNRSACERSRYRVIIGGIKKCH
jgi:hypothetical protein